MNANELKANARERLAEIAKQRAALEAEEREIRVMLGDVPPAPTVNPLRGGHPVWPLAPLPYDVRPLGLDKYEPGTYGPIVTCGTTTSCAIHPTVLPRLGDVLAVPE